MNIMTVTGRMTHMKAVYSDLHPDELDDGTSVDGRLGQFVLLLGVGGWS